MEKKVAVQKYKWIEIAEREKGVSEVAGNGSNPRIVEYHKATRLGASDDSVAWCSSFVNWVMMKAGCHRTYSAAARSWLQSDSGERLKSFKPGCIVVFARGNQPWQGHVAFGIEMDGDYIKCLGGNQGDKVSVAKYPKIKALGYIWPKEIK
jgi:uncharacterized protein (TIGR02594 family)